MSTARIGRLGTRARAAASRNDVWIRVLARIGLAAKGVSFGIVGVLAGKLALGDGGKATSREGALATLARESFGEVLLIALAVGFAAYALWRLAQTFFDREREGEDPVGLAKRAGYFGRALIYAGLAYTAAKIVLEAAEPSSQNRRAREATAHLLSWPGGTWIVAAAGIAIAGVGVFNGYRGITRSFLDKLATAGMSATMRSWVSRVGTVGLLARMVVFGLIGWFLVKAALDYEPRKAIGIDGALQKLAHQSYGSWLLGVAALGLVAYAIFGLAEARYRRV